MVLPLKVFNVLAGVGAAIGALIGLNTGFHSAGAGGAILGGIIGCVAGVLGGGIIAVILISIFGIWDWLVENRFRPIFVPLGIGLVLYLIYSLWGVGG